MKRSLGLFVLLFCVVIRAEERPAPATIPIPELEQLQWTNLRLQAANHRLQADQLDAKANEKLTEIKNKLAGKDAEQYDFELKGEKIQLVRRSDPKPKETK